MGEVINMADYVERRAATDPDRRQAITQRMAEISLDILLLQSEKNRLENQLLGDPDQPA